MKLPIASLVAAVGLAGGVALAARPATPLAIQAAADRQRLEAGDVATTLPAAAMKPDGFDKWPVANRLKWYETALQSLAKENHRLKLGVAATRPAG